MKYTFQAPVQIGDHVYVIVHADGETIIDELTVTEVASRGVFVSAYDPPEDDLGWYLPYADEGESWFFGQTDGRGLRRINREDKAWRGRLISINSRLATA